ncbi:MAG: DUF2461 domain-containing protein [Acidobacteriota bacterium]
MATHFEPEALKFLRGLAKHNDREWFNARKDVYERTLKAPMLAVIDAVNHAMVEFAPDHVRDPKKTMMRIYRDTRFAKDKRPYKRQVSAWWARRGMEKTSGGGFYMHVHPNELLISCGVYMPERAQLLAIREWMAENHEAYRAMVKSVLKAKVGGVKMTEVGGEGLTRMPKGFAADHPAGELLRAKNWGVHVSLPGEVALEPRLVKEIVRGFTLAAPIVDALNGAILLGLQRSQGASRPLF